MNWTIIKRIVVLGCLLGSFSATKTTYFSSGLWRVMRSGSSTTTSGVRHCGWMPEKLYNTARSRNCTKKGYGDCLVVCGRSHPSQLLESGRNDYDEVLPTNWRNAPEAPTYVPEIGQYEGPILLHNNARPHVAQLTLQKLNELDNETLPHPPYSPDLSPTDYHFFKRLDNLLREKCFKSRDDAESSFKDFLASRTPNFNANGINKLVSHMEKCVESNGSYFD